MVSPSLSYDRGLIMYEINSKLPTTQSENKTIYT